ncbi:LOW QUALITY PROTEIN: RISC-loading complex subunit tarbp2-like [Vespula maculifrons]|uniref:RISC-loading complex subunit tarbp2-like n=1 Tax=Vespula maculifrons TaxID=7453 RepID=A0ABD2CY47_VESMC
MGKTAIMILQELGMKEGFLPVYTLLRSQTGKQVNIFTYEVKYKDFSATGQALSKKDAKQKAAQNMLTLLEDPNDISKTKPLSSSNDIYPDASPSTSGQALLDSTLMHEDLRNYVGSLQEYCVENKLTQAEYQTTDITGPAHEQVFTMSCTVGSITEEATGTTKKQVKQRVAEKNVSQILMIRQLQTKMNADLLILLKTVTICLDIDKDVLDELSLKVDNCKLNETESQANQKKKFLDPNIKSYLGRALQNEVTEFRKSSFYVHNTVCNGSEEKLIEIFNTVKRLQEKFYGYREM